MSKQRTITALLLGDVIGQPGGRALFMGLPQLIKKLRADLVVINGENAADGFGLTEDLARQFFSLGVHVITTGNHIWQREEIRPFLDKDTRILRPANYPAQVPGHGYTVLEIGGLSVGVVNLQGRHQMVPIDCPFQTGAAVVEKLRRQTKLIFVDFHAESAMEKEALAAYLDGKVSVVVGTHTHVQTADERILDKGTGYITDLGLSGPIGGVIGSDPNIAIERQLTQIPLRNQILDAPSYLQGVVCSVDPDTGKTVSIKRISEQFGL
ncbi:TIGR00282 family metallophosphoesterase [Pleomorphochaeta sp. DL1XJH-081]|uniref:TIGR00282 family metallophosphoesterase n=1 Tax=Pleomorphochaeta sp. DL1XJH-081 TaxID=3409690 RepID=UPI003BB75B82